MDAMRKASRVEAYRVKEENDFPSWVFDNISRGIVATPPYSNFIFVTKPEGVQRAAVGDWLVRDVTTGDVVVVSFTRFKSLYDNLPYPTIAKLASEVVEVPIDQVSTSSTYLVRTVVEACMAVANLAITDDLINEILAKYKSRRSIT